MNNSSRNKKNVLLALVIAVIALGGFMLSQKQRSPAVEPVDIQRFVPGDGQLKTLVGKLDAPSATIASRGNAGVMVFGPYVSLMPGNYSVSWIGTVQSDSTPRLEVTSMKTGLLAAATPRLAVSPSSHPLQTIAFTLKQPIGDLEFRVLVASRDALTVNAIELATQAGAAGAH